MNTHAYSLEVLVRITNMNSQLNNKQVNRETAIQKTKSTVFYLEIFTTVAGVSSQMRVLPRIILIDDNKFKKSHTPYMHFSKFVKNKNKV
jgi:hypothetical protein